MKFSIITLLTISSLFFIQPTESTFPIPGLIEHVCRLTPHYHLCVLTLKSHAIARKITSQHDVSAFAKIALEVIAAKTPVILATLHKVHEQCEQPEFKTALEGCIRSYTQISTDILPKALGCVDKGDLEGIKQHALTTANLVASCQKKCNAFTASSLSAFANRGSGSSSAGSTKTGSSAGGSINAGSSAGGSVNTGSSTGGSINTGSSAGGSINTGSSAGGSINTGSSAGGSINTGSSASAGSSKTGSASAGSTNTGSGSASAGSSSAGSTGSASAVKPAVKAAAKVVGESNVYVQNMCAITVSIVTKVAAAASKQTTLS